MKPTYETNYDSFSIMQEAAYPRDPAFVLAHVPIHLFPEPTDLQIDTGMKRPDESLFDGAGKRLVYWMSSGPARGNRRSPVYMQRWVESVSLAYADESDLGVLRARLVGWIFAQQARKFEDCLRSIAGGQTSPPCGDICPRASYTDWQDCPGIPGLLIGKYEELGTVIQLGPMKTSIVADSMYVWQNLGFSVHAPLYDSLGHRVRWESQIDPVNV